MNTRRVSVRSRFLGSALLLAVALVSAASAAEAVTIVSGSDDGTGTSLHVQHRASRMVPFELFYIELNLQGIGSDPLALEVDLKKRLDAALERVKPLPGVDVAVGALALVRQTPETNPRMAQRYSESGISAPPEVWKGTLHVSCVGRDKGGLQGALTELQRQGAILSEIHFDLGAETWAKTRKELVAETISALRAEVSQVADTMDMRVDHYTTIQVNEDNDMRQIQQRQIRFQENGGAQSLPNGDIEVSVGANIGVKLAPKSNP